MTPKLKLRDDPRLASLACCTSYLGRWRTIRTYPVSQTKSGRRQNCRVRVTDTEPTPPMLSGGSTCCIVVKKSVLTWAHRRWSLRANYGTDRSVFCRVPVRLHIVCPARKRFATTKKQDKKATLGVPLPPSSPNQKQSAYWKEPHADPQSL